MPDSRPHPKYREIVTVVGSKINREGQLAYRLAEYPMSTWGAQNFRPIVHDKQKACDADFLSKFRQKERVE
jgi:hypothetical protein